MLWLHACMYSTCMPSAQRPEEGVETSMWVEELNQGPLQEQVPFISELSPVPLYGF